MNLSRRSFITRATLIGISLVGVTGLSACNSSSSDKNKLSTSDNKVVLGYWGGTCEAPIYIGYEKGYFKEEGLEPELLLITSDVAALMANSELDVFELTPDKFKPMEQGLEVKIIDSLHIGCIQGAASPESNIKSVADLEGKRIACNVGSIAQIQISSQMVRMGKDPKKVKWLNYPNPQVEAAMNQGEIDGFAAYDPWADIAKANGATIFYSNTYDEDLKDYLCCFVGLSSRALERNPKLGPKLSRAFGKANKFLNEHPEEATDLIIEKGYVPVNTDSGFTREIMLKEITDYPWISGDKQLLDNSFEAIWKQIHDAGAMEDAPSDVSELDKYINETLYSKMVDYQGDK